MKIVNQALPDVLLIEPELFNDERGFFFESFNQRKFKSLTGIKNNFVQDNHSKSKKGVLRGMHYQQEPKAQGKLVKVISGEIYDVVVDLRKWSKTFGQYCATTLSSESKCTLWVPPGFAHGFLTLSETAEVEYKVDEYYDPSHEVCIIWNDETLNIKWPDQAEPIVSDKDQRGVPFLEAAHFEEKAAAKPIVAKGAELVSLPTHAGTQDIGKLIAVERLSQQFPFDLKRIYYIFGADKTVRRGFHAHRNLKQMLVCVSGECKISLDDGKVRETVILDRADKALVIDKPLWREIFDFSENSVLMVLASETYNTEDYIWDYNEFLSYLEVVA